MHSTLSKYTDSKDYLSLADAFNS